MDENKLADLKVVTVIQHDALLLENRINKEIEDQFAEWKFVEINYQTTSHDGRLVHTAVLVFEERNYDR